jgi:hypothetical protein
VTQLVEANSGVTIAFHAGNRRHGDSDDDIESARVAKSGPKWKDGSGTVAYPVGDMYSGSFKDNMRHGPGKMQYANGDVYDGEWHEDRQHGEGKMVWQQMTDIAPSTKGWRYVGRWARGRLHGHGQLWFDTEGGSYVGQWEENLRHGLGKETVGGDVYEGAFANGIRNGDGVLTTRDGVVISGKFIDGICRDLDAKIRYSEQERFEGAVVDRARHGEGRMICANGDIYDGEFVNDRRHGVGLLRSANGDVYEGQFDDDAMHGAGTMTFADGTTYSGRMRHGLKHGAGTLTLSGSDVAFNVMYKENVLTSKTQIR